ncbi:hypothetical protein IJJ08_05065 [bacterium]|nr:hypothetical protein [bacterium]
MTVLDYRQLAKQKQLEIRIATLNQARENVLGRMREIGLSVPDVAVPGGRVDIETLAQEQKLINHLQEKTYTDMLAQQAQDLIEQAREGSRFVALERQLTAHPETLEKVNFAPLQEEQSQYQLKQLEIFDYLTKHFSQFNSMEVQGLPESGAKFFDQVVRATIDKMSSLVDEGRALQQQIAEKTKKLAKLKRREQRELEQIHAEAGRGDDEGGEELVRQNQAYKELLAEIRATTVLRTSLLNQTNNLIDQGIEQLHRIDIHLGSIVGQNQTTREILFGLKTENEVWQTRQLQKTVAELLLDFDRQVAQVLITEVGKRFEGAEIPPEDRRFWRDLVEEVIQFQEYLGQIMGDSQQVIEGNLDDLENARVKFGRLVLDFSVQAAIL